MLRQLTVALMCTVSRQTYIAIAADQATERNAAPSKDFHLTISRSGVLCVHSVETPSHSSLSAVH
jgi:hypothetical protein